MQRVLGLEGPADFFALNAEAVTHYRDKLTEAGQAPATIARLVDMGVEPYMISSTLMAVLAQRLVRKICRECRVEVPVDAGLLKELGLSEGSAQPLTKMFRGQGCPACRGTGYRGRAGIYELLLMSEPIKKLLLESKEAHVIRETAIKDGMITMRQFALKLIQDGVTTVDEVLQVTRED